MKLLKFFTLIILSSLNLIATAIADDISIDTAETIENALSEPLNDSETYVETIQISEEASAIISLLPGSPNVALTTSGTALQVAICESLVEQIIAFNLEEWALEFATQIQQRGEGEPILPIIVLMTSTNPIFVWNSFGCQPAIDI